MSVSTDLSIASSCLESNKNQANQSRTTFGKTLVLQASEKQATNNFSSFFASIPASIFAAPIVLTWQASLLSEVAQIISERQIQ